jgi:hypothetical protein
MSQIMKDNIYKILSILSCSFTICTIFILWNNPILHYQLSAYSGIPAIAWIFLFIAFLLTSFVLVGSQIGKVEAANRWFIIGLVMLILIVAVALLFPQIRGAWFMRKGDALPHVSLTGHMLAYHSTIDNYYPPLHILSASLVMIANVCAYDAISLLGILFYLLYIVWTYSLARVVLKDKSMIALAVIAAATIPPGSIVALPYALSAMIMPLVISSYLTRNGSISRSITCLLLLSLLVFFHPLTAVVLIFCLFGIELLQDFRSSWAHQNTPKQAMETRARYNTALFFSVTFLAWMVYLNFHLFAGQVEHLTRAITGPVQVASRVHYIVDFPTLGIEGWVFVELFVRKFGDNVIFLAFNLIAILLVLKRTRSGAALEYEHKLFSLSGWTVVMGLTTVIFLVHPGAARGFCPTRLVFLLTTLTPVFVAYALYHVYTHLEAKSIRKFHGIAQKVKESLLLLPLTILIIAFVMMTFTVHPSPFVNLSNVQLMRAEIRGATWLLEHTNLEGNIAAYDLRINRDLIGVSVALSGHYADSSHPFVVHSHKLTKGLPNHMGYKSYYTMGEFFGSVKLPAATGFKLLDSGYVTLTRERVIRALELYAPLGWLNQGDLERFYNDKTVNQVYSNFEYSVFWVPPSRK